MTRKPAKFGDRRLWVGLMGLLLGGCVGSPDAIAPSSPAPAVEITPAPAADPTDQAVQTEVSSPPSDPASAPESVPDLAIVSPDETEDAAIPDLAIASAREDPTDRLQLGGFEDPEAVRAFVTQLRTAATAGDLPALVAMVRFPFTTYDNGVPVTTYDTAAELLPVADEVISPPVLQAMQAASYDQLFVNGEGAMIGNGEVWFDQREDGIKIRAINSPE